MKRPHLALLVAAGCIALFLFAPGSSDTASAIEREVERGPGHVFALADTADFEWDRVFLFAPYTPKSEIEAELGFRWPGRFSSDIEDHDGIVLVVFEQGGRVVEHFDLPRAPADLTPASNTGRKGIARAAARFLVGNNGAVSLDPTRRAHASERE